MSYILATADNIKINMIKDLIQKLLDKNNRLSEIFTEEILEKIFNDNEILSKLCEDDFIKELREDVDERIFNSDTINKKEISEAIIKKLRNIDIIEAIKEKRDVITEIYNTEELIKIFGSKYNSISRTDKYYGVIGKLIGAYLINKTVNEWEDIDKPKLIDLKDRHKGERGFIICNGPSLNQIDFSKLKNEITIGTNGFYLNFDHIGFKPTYYVVEDELVAEDRKDDINDINGPVKLFAQRLAYCLDRKKDVIFLNHSPDYNLFINDRILLELTHNFSPDISMVTYGGNTVTYTCFQVAYHLGIREVYLIGADHRYVVPERYADREMNENYVIESHENDVNHFNKNYFGKGYRWHNPKVHRIEKSYENAKKYFEYNNGKIYNATIGGALEVFDRVNYFDLFKERYVNIDYKSFVKNQKNNEDKYYKSILNNQIEKVEKGIEYKGDWLAFDGNVEIGRNIKPLTCSFEAEIVLKSECFNDDYLRYDDNNPPMPLFLKPIYIYQLTKNIYRITVHNYNCYIYFKSATWNKIAIKYNKKNSKLNIVFNDKLIKTFNDIKVKLAGQLKVGNGFFNRFWKGKIGYAQIISHTLFFRNNLESLIDKKTSKYKDRHFIKA